MANRPKPSALKALNGNPGKRAFNKNEPKPEVTEPEMPKGMSTFARREWKRVVPLLLELGMLTNLDRAVLEGYCEAYGESKQAQKIIRRFGLTVVNSRGDVKPHPAVGIRDKAQKRMKSFAIELGLSVPSRTRFNVAPKKPDGSNDNKQTALKAFLNKRRQQQGTAEPSRLQ